MADSSRKRSLTAAGLALCASLIGGAEGLRETAYPDPATKGPPWTVCYGHTGGVKPGDHYSVAECMEMLIADLPQYVAGIDACVTAAIPETRTIALVDFAYNVGVKAACGSSVVKLINAGRMREGCDALMKWNKAAGIVFPGLTLRRQREREWCLRGVAA